MTSKANENSRCQSFQYQKCNFMLTTAFEKVRLGFYSGTQYQSLIKSNLAQTHLLTGSGFEQSTQCSCIISGDLDPVESRYILVGKSSGGLAIFDTKQKTNKKVFRQVARIKGGERNAHKTEVTCVQWYPVDAGLFATSSCDRSIKVWDPNTMKKVEEFKFDDIAYHHHMSPIAWHHSLIAVAGGKGDTILCDLRSGSSSHRLFGHDEPIYVVQWSRHHEDILASGGRDRRIRLWDVRCGKSCLKILDSENTVEVDNSCKYKKVAIKRKLPISHSSQITSLSFTCDGLWLISFGYDGHLKVWNTSTWKNMNVRFGITYTDLRKSIQMAVTHNLNPDLVFVPSKSKVFVYEINSGALRNILSAHFSTVLGAIYNPDSGDLYTYGNDRNFLVWTPEKCTEKVHLAKDVELPPSDNWSSDEEVEL